MRNFNCLAESNIRVLINKRCKFLKVYEDSYDEKTFKYTIEEPKEIDELRDQIIKLIFKHESSLNVDIIIETLTHLGYAPNILYDDNGHFAITDDGFQSICSGDDPEDVELSFNIEKKYWKDTIREALHIYLETFNKELWLDINRENKLKRIMKNIY